MSEPKNKGFKYSILAGLTVLLLVLVIMGIIKANAALTDMTVQDRVIFIPTVNNDGSYIYSYKSVSSSFWGHNVINFIDPWVQNCAKYEPDEISDWSSSIYTCMTSNAMYLYGRVQFWQFWNYRTNIAGPVRMPLNMVSPLAQFSVNRYHGPYEADASDGCYYFDYNGLLCLSLSNGLYYRPYGSVGQYYSEDRLYFSDNGGDPLDVLVYRSGTWYLESFENTEHSDESPHSVVDIHYANAGFIWCEIYDPEGYYTSVQSIPEDLGFYIDYWNFPEDVPSVSPSFTPSPTPTPVLDSSTYEFIYWTGSRYYLFSLDISGFTDQFTSNTVNAMNTGILGELNSDYPVLASGCFLVSKNTSWFYDYLYFTCDGFSGLVYDCGTSLISTDFNLLKETYSFSSVPLGSDSISRNQYYVFSEFSNCLCLVLSEGGISNTNHGIILSTFSYTPVTVPANLSPFSKSPFLTEFNTSSMAYYGLSALYGSNASSGDPLGPSPTPSPIPTPTPEPTPTAYQVIPITPEPNYYHDLPIDINDLDNPSMDLDDPAEAMDRFKDAFHQETTSIGIFALAFSFLPDKVQSLCWFVLFLFVMGGVLHLLLYHGGD